jgi:SAM-dependent methyltransferase
VRPLVRKLIPPSLLERLRLLEERRRNRNRSAEEVFTEIYEQNRWGGSQGEFYSGTGSADERTVSAYVSSVSERATSEGFRGLTFVDLGCGDFRVSRLLRPLCSHYIGVDIVAPLIGRNTEQYADATTRFVHLDIVRDELPDGDVCLVRHVLQHLSNQQIVAILRKLEKYRWVLITEHYPTDNGRIRPNVDKVHGGFTRALENSGVYLSEPPFALPAQTVVKVMEIAGAASGEVDPGVVRTFLYTPGGLAGHGP